MWSGWRISQALGKWPGVLLVAGLPAAIAVLRWDLPFNQDTSWYIAAARNWLEGGTLYAEVIELNPPMAYYLTAPATLLSDVSGLTDVHAFLLLLCGLMSTSTGLALVLLARTPLTPRQRLGMLAGIAAALMLVPLGNYGQREHLMVAFAMPLVLQRVLRQIGGPDGLGLQIACAMFAAPGLMLKPHFFAIPASIAVAEAISARRPGAAFSLPIMVLAGLAVAYLSFVAVQHHDYLTKIMPLARATYSDYGISSLHIVSARIVLSLPLIFGVWFLLARRGLHDMQAGLRSRPWQAA